MAIRPWWETEDGTAERLFGDIPGMANPALFADQGIGQVGRGFTVNQGNKLKDDNYAYRPYNGILPEAANYQTARQPFIPMRQPVVQPAQPARQTVEAPRQIPQYQTSRAMVRQQLPTIPIPRNQYPPAMIKGAGSIFGIGSVPGAQDPNSKYREQLYEFISGKTNTPPAGYTGATIRYNRDVIAGGSGSFTGGAPKTNDISISRNMNPAWISAPFPGTKGKKAKTKQMRQDDEVRSIAAIYTELMSDPNMTEEEAVRLLTQGGF